MPVWLIPLLVDLGSRIIEAGFKAATKKCPTDQSKIWDKIGKKDKEMSDKMRGKL